MTRTAILLILGLFSAPLLAQEQIYVYVKYKDAKGGYVRHKIDCLDSACKVVVKTQQRQTNLSAEQKKALLEALQAESRRFVAAAEAVSSSNQVKVKLRYDSPGKRLVIERRLPAERPAALSPKMLQVIKAHLELDLSEPLLPGPAAADDTSAGSGAPGQNE